MTDQRPENVRHLNMRMTIPTYRNKAAWEARAKWLREHIRACTGLLIEPERKPLKPKIFDRLERDGYTIEKAYFESRPGFYVCGNLFRPAEAKGRCPGIACPHGHWKEGRFGHDEPAKGSVTGRCITLARMGCVVFAYDMVGYNDSGRQIGHRIKLDTPRNQAWGIGLMQLQSWNTVRALDFLQSLPDVDGKRLAVTGCSGGGTQTFMVMGIDPRVKVAAPVNMVSGIMQGGCECENMPLLRIDSNNIEVAALMAPRPLILCSVTGDWTRETPKVEYPSVRGIYKLYGARDRVTNVHDKAVHGYNKVHREAVYNFFRRWLMDARGGKKYVEPPFTPEKKTDLLVWRGKGLPKNAVRRKALEEQIITEARRQRDALLPKKPADLRRFRSTLGTLYRHAIMAELPETDELLLQAAVQETHQGFFVTRFRFGREGCGDSIAGSLYCPESHPKRMPATLLVHPQGRPPRDMILSLLAAGQLVLTIETYLTGRAASLRKVLDENRKEKKYFTTYNRTELVERVQDILTGLAWLKAQHAVTDLSLIGLEKAGMWCLLAAPFTPAKTSIVADLNQIGNDEDPRWRKDLFTPCILKAGGLATAVGLTAPRRLLIHNLADGFITRPLRAAYRAARGDKQLRILRDLAGAEKMTNWITAT